LQSTLAGCGLFVLSDAMSNDYTRNRVTGDYRGAYPRRQAAAFALRELREADNLVKTVTKRIDLDETRTWTTREGQTISLREMEAGHLVNVIGWMVRHQTLLYKHRNRQAPQGDTKRWLRDQPAFRALVIEAARRNLAYPNDVYDYLKVWFIAPQSDSPESLPDHADPKRQKQQAALLKQLASQEVNPNGDHSLRAITMEEPPE